MESPKTRERRQLTEEQLADAHVRFSAGRGLVHSGLSVTVLTLIGAVVLIPFAYMILISIKAPAEVGNGRLLPAGLESLIQSGTSRVAWVRVRLTSEQSADLIGAQQVFVGPGDPSNYTARVLEAPPAGSVPARVLALDKPRTGEAVVLALLEALDENRVLTAAGRISLFMPGPEAGTWVASPAQARQRTPGDVLGRLFSNYHDLLDWDELKASSGWRSWLYWISNGYPRWFLNSMFVALATVLLGVFFDSLAAFAFAKFSFPGRNFLFGVLLLTVMIPYPVTLVPTFFIFAKLGLYNTYAALIIPGLVSAFGIFLVRQYLQSVPDDMLDAARVDGAGDFMVYRHVILPTARPVLAALAVFRFIFQWNTYLYPLVLTNRDSMKTVQLGLATLEDAHGSVEYGMQMAGAALAVVPVLIVYAFMQKHFISGITMGAVKD